MRGRLGIKEDKRAEAEAEGTGQPWCGVATCVLPPSFPPNAIRYLFLLVKVLLDGCAS